MGEAAKSLLFEGFQSSCHVVLRGRGGSYGTGLALVARLGPRWRRCRGEALGDIDLRFAWQGLHLVTSTFAVVLGDMTFTLRGRRGAW